MSKTLQCLDQACGVVLTVSHNEDCPVNDSAKLLAHLQQFRLPSGRLDMQESIKNPLCNCGFMQRLHAALDRTEH